MKADFINNLNDTKYDTLSAYSKTSSDSVFTWPIVDKNETISLDINDDGDDGKDNKFNGLIANLIFEEICLEVIGSEFERPSVPDCILESFKEMFDD